VSRQATLASFVPVEIAESGTAPGGEAPSSTATQVRTGTSLPQNDAAAPSGSMEIELGNGTRVRVGRDVDGAALRRVLAALEQRR